MQYKLRFISVIGVNLRPLRTIYFSRFNILLFKNQWTQIQIQKNVLN
jgi:hypothetical protein